MATKIKKITIKMSVVIVAFMFACSSGNRQNQTNSQNEQTSSVKTSDSQIVQTSAASENGEANEDKTADVLTATESENGKVNEEKTAEAETKTVSETQEKFIPEWMPFPLVDVQPFLDGKPWREELPNYINKNNKFREVADEAGISGYFEVSCFFFIDGDGIPDAPKKSKGVGFYIRMVDGGSLIEADMAPPPYQLLVDELLRIIYSTKGKWTPAIHDGKPMKVRIGCGFDTINNNL